MKTVATLVVILCTGLMTGHSNMANSAEVAYPACNLFDSQKVGSPIKRPAVYSPFLIKGGGGSEGERVVYCVEMKHGTEQGSVPLANAQFVIDDASIVPMVIRDSQGGSITVRVSEKDFNSYFRSDMSLKK